MERAAALLAAVGEWPGRPVADLAASAGLNRSTAWRLLTTLEDHGLVERDPSGRYRVGHAVVRLAAGAGGGALARRARPAVERLAADTGETASLALVRGLELVAVDQVAPPRVLAPDWSGRSIPLHATSTGKAFLAALAGADRALALAAPLPRYTARTVCDPAALARDLDAAAAAGWAASVDELEDDLAGVSAAACAGGVPLAVLSAWGPSHRLAPRIGELGPRVAAAARELEALLAP